jgi:hypothetical protein
MKINLIFLVRKHHVRVKALACADENTQRDYVNNDYSAVHAAATESILLATPINANYNREIIFQRIFQLHLCSLT